MFWKKKEKQPNQPKEEQPKQPKVKEPSPREILVKKITEEVENLTEGQAVIYQLPEFYTFARFLGVELNPTFPQQGKKYLEFQDNIADGKPMGKRSYMNVTNKASDYAEWVAGKDSEQYGHVKHFQ
jgi:hypothetical protein